MVNGLQRNCTHRFDVEVMSGQTLYVTICEDTFIRCHFAEGALGVHVNKFHCLNSR